MKRIHTIGLLAAAMAFAAGTDSATAEHAPQVLNETWKVKMDSDRDGKVSRMEYMTFGSDYLKKSGKPVDRHSMVDKFNGYDRNRDGFITDEDPLCRDPIEIFLDKIKGRWFCENNAKGLVSFTFMDDGEAEVVRNGLALRDEAQGLLTYGVVLSGRGLVCMDISMANGTPSEWHIKCIIKFLADNRIKMRAYFGDDGTPFPREFIPGYDADTYYLDRVVKKKRPESKRTPKSGELTLFGIAVPSGGR